MLPLPANFRRVSSQQSMAAVNKKRLLLQKSPHKVMNVHKDSRLNKIANYSAAGEFTGRKTVKKRKGGGQAQQKPENSEEK